MAKNGTRTPALLLATLAATSLCWSSLSFIGAQQPAGGQSSLVARRIGAGYFDRQSAKDHDQPFGIADASGDTHEVTFKKRPFGILRYQADKDGKGAMTMNIIPKSRYPGDP